MDVLKKKIKKMLAGVNIIWLGVIFGSFYWVIESFRDVFLYSKEGFLESLISPDILTFWFRFLMLCIILIFSFYAESRRQDIAAIKRKSIFYKLKNPGVVITGILLSVFYWLIESINDALFFSKGSLINQIFFPEYKDFWNRFFSVMILILFSIFIQSHINRNKQLQKLLRKVNVKLKKDNKFKNDYLSFVAHEVKNPLAVIKEGILLCFDSKIGELNDTQKKLLKNSLNNTDRLNRFVTDILDIAKIEKHKITLHKSNFNICDLCMEVLEQFELNCEKENITFGLYIPSSRINVYADRDKIIQVFVNLLKNSVNYIGNEGKIIVKIKKANDEVRCYVKDNGKGIPGNELNKIFLKFQRSENPEFNKKPGFGLGLSITKGLVEAHRGKIWVESEQGKGTTFCFTIPLKKKEELMETVISENIEQVMK